MSCGSDRELPVPLGVFLSYLSYRPPDEMFVSQVKVNGTLKAESRVSLLQTAWPPTDSRTVITPVNRFTARDCFLAWKLSSSKHIYHLVNRPGCWEELENYDFLNLNIQNASLLNLGHFEVEMYLALRMIFYIGGSESLYSSHQDTPCFLSALLAGCNQPL